MLSRKRCRHTGVINFFAEDPHLPVGSAIRISRRSGYHWRCYTDPCAAGGTARDLKTAQRQVAERWRRAAERTHALARILDAA
jgi:hypothetical protein